MLGLLVSGDPEEDENRGPKKRGFGEKRPFSPQGDCLIIARRGDSPAESGTPSGEPSGFPYGEHFALAKCDRSEVRIPRSRSDPRGGAT